MRDRIIEQLNKIRDNTSELLGKFSRKTKIAAGITALVIIIFAFVLAFMMNRTEYEILYTGLEESEAIEVIGVLNTQTIKYQRRGDTILVPQKDVDKVKVSLAAEGYPKSGFTYDIFTNNVGLHATDFEKYKYAQFELENRMAETIKQFSGVSNATVAIAMAEEQTYVLQEDVKENTAAVTVTMENGESPSKKQVEGIRRLVARGVPGLEISNVTVVDGNGKDVTGDDADTQEGSAALKLNVEEQIEASIKSNVLHLLQPVFGEENIRVSVKCSVDMDKKIKEIIEYIPSQDNKGVLQHVDGDYEIQAEGQVTAGVPGTETNADIPVYPGVTTDGTEIYFKDDRSLDYLVSQVKEQIESSAGELTDVSVAVAVDNKDLTPAKAGELRQAIALAVGIEAAQADNKIAIFNAPFYTPEPEAVDPFTELFLKYPFLKILIPLVIALIIAIVVVVMTIIKKKKIQKRAEALAEEEAKRLQEVESLVQLDELEKSREDELKSQIQDFTDVNPEISAQLLKTWLRGEEDK